MGEDRPAAEVPRYTVAEAADMLGISSGAVRNRLSRGSLKSVKKKGTVYVLLPADMSRDAKRDADDTPGGMPHPDTDALTSELRDRLRYVEEQLEAERQAHADARMMLMAALEKIPPAIEPPREAPGAPETAREEPEPSEPRSAAGGPQTATERPQASRSLWSRIFGR